MCIYIYIHTYIYIYIYIYVCKMNYHVLACLASDRARLVAIKNKIQYLAQLKTLHAADVDGHVHLPPPQGAQEHERRRRLIGRCRQTHCSAPEAATVMAPPAPGGYSTI